METEIFKLAVTNGIFCVLFIFLLFYVLKKSDEREKKLYEEIEKSRGLLEKFSEKYDIIINEIKDIKDSFRK